MCKKLKCLGIQKAAYYLNQLAHEGFVGKVNFKLNFERWVRVLKTKHRKYISGGGSNIYKSLRQALGNDEFVSNLRHV